MITDPFILSLISMIIGIFIGVCCSVLGFIIHLDLHYTDAEIEELCDMYGVARREDRYNVKH